MRMNRGSIEGSCPGVMRRLCVAAVSLFAATQAQAAVDCVGKVARVLLYSDGTVNIVGAWRGRRPPTSE